MRSPIETWIADTSLPDESLVAFDESVVAFKAGANRAALLCSYFAWGLALRERSDNESGNTLQNSVLIIFDILEARSKLRRARDRK